MVKKFLREFVREIVEYDRDVKKICVFDFDDTLVRTESMVHVTNVETGRKFDITPAEFSSYVRQPGDELDFSDFVEIVEPTIVEDVVEIFLESCSELGQENVVILTARGQDSKKSIEEFLSSLGVGHVEVVTIGAGHMSGSVAALKKSNWIRDMILTRRPDVVEFFDDSIQNIDSVRKLQREFVSSGKKVKIIVHRV